MSRIGLAPVNLPNGADAKIEADCFTVKGSKGQQSVPILNLVEVAIDGEAVNVKPLANERGKLTKRARQNWGTMRALIQNAVIGATIGYTRKLILTGVGYRAALKGKDLELSLGLSHEVIHPIPEGINVTLEGDRNNVVVLSGTDKAQLGQMAGELRAYRKTEPYGGKGVRYEDEIVYRKISKKKTK